MLLFWSNWSPGVLSGKKLQGKKNFAVSSMLLLKLREVVFISSSWQSAFLPGTCFCFSLSRDSRAVASNIHLERVL